MNPFQKRSKAGILLELFLDSFLLLLFALQAFVIGCVLAYGYLPVPTDWANKQVANYLPEGLRLEAETIRLKLNGDVELGNVNAWTDSIDQPILSSNTAVVHLGIAEGKTIIPSVESVVVSSGTLFLPAVYSPDGLSRPILEKTAFKLIPESDMIRIESFAALHETIRLRGSIEWPITPSSGSTADAIPLSQSLRSSYQSISTAIKEKDRFNIFTNPTLLFHLTANEDNSVKLSTTLSSRELTHEQVVGENFRLRGEFKIQDKQITATSGLRINAKHLDAPKYKIKGEWLDAIVQPDQWDLLLKGKLPEVKLFARKLSVYEVDLIAPIMKVLPAEFPEIEFSGATSGLKGAVTFTGEVDVSKQTGTVHANGSVDLVSLIPEGLSESLPQLRFGSAPNYDLQLAFAEGFTLDSAYLNADAYRISVGDITFDYVDARASFKDNVFSLDHVYARRDWQWVDLQFMLDTTTWDYKVTLIGSTVPYDYNDLLPRWWESIFRRFDFSQVENNHGDFIIYGNTKKSATDLYYGHVSVEKVSFMDVLIDQGTVVVRGRGRYSEVTDINARSNGGWAKGSIGFSSKKDEVRAPVSIRMKFDTELKLDDTKKLFGENIKNILDDFKTETMPRAQLTGAIFHKAYPEYQGLTFFDLKANSNGPISFKNVPLDALSFTLYGRNNVTHIRNLDFGYADGSGSGMIDILTPKDQPASLRYELSITDADKGQAIRNLPQLDSIESDLADNKTKKPSNEGREEGRVDLSLHASGPVDNAYSHTGYGAFTMRSEQLGAIQLLGPLSRVLKDTKFSFTSFNLNTMAASFDLTDGTINFKELQIDGPRTRIRAPGTMKLEDQSLDMRVSVNLFANVGSKDSAIQKMGNVLTSPLTNLLTFDLTGTLKEQKWRSLYDPRKLIPNFSATPKE
ncbi:MAG: hypothetical protein ACSHYA_00950 [Opitutaceae bacterium]